MITPSLYGTAIEWMERGRLPDPVIRAGIRHLLRQRLARETTGTRADRCRRKQRFLTAMAAGPVAPEPAKANAQHYGLPPAFFEQVLGPRMKYSSCLWLPGTSGLGAAEDAALEATCRHADLAD